jgi:RNA polymerase sigma-54 factor
MGMTLTQGLKQSQNLVMTPSLVQAIKLLQLNHLELVEQLNQELMENPTLEELPGSTMEPVADVEKSLHNSEIRHDSEEQQNGTRDGEVDWGKVLEGLGDDSFRQRGASGMDEMPPIETNLVSASSLPDHLEWQLQMQQCTDEEREAAMILIRSLNDRGWLSAPISELVSENKLDLEVAESALQIIQQLDPVGCGSKDLTECLLIQAKIHYPEDPVLPQIICNHLHDLEKRNYAVMAKALGIDVEDAVEYHRMLKLFEPWPGRAFSNEEPQYIAPDVYVYRVGDDWQVAQNEDGLPKLKVSNYYRQVLQGKDSTREEREYIKERLNSADFLLKSIYKRQDTITKVMRAILHRQKPFFDKGPAFLRPMVLRDIADEVGVHESTVSRVTSSKYVQCPQGLFELKYFFNNGVNAVHGEQVAAEAVKQRIRKLIQMEDRNNPYSDEQIVQVLKKENIDIARRTVAKYRESFNILPATKRKHMS